MRSRTQMVTSQTHTCNDKSIYHTCGNWHRDADWPFSKVMVYNEILSQDKCYSGSKALWCALTRSSGKKNADALDDLLPAFKATALPSQSITGDPLDPPLVPDAAYRKTISEYKNGSLGFSCNNTKTYITQCLVTAVAENHLIIETTILVTAKF